MIVIATISFIPQTSHVVGSLGKFLTWKGLLAAQVRGKNIPKPVQNWFQCGLSSRVLELLQKSGFAKPMPIQAQALPAIMSGRDCIGIAKTGSGKTLAFVLPMLRHIKDQASISVSPPANFSTVSVCTLFSMRRRSVFCRLSCAPHLQLCPCVVNSMKTREGTVLSTWCWQLSTELERVGTLHDCTGSKGLTGLCVVCGCSRRWHRGTDLWR